MSERLAFKSAGAVRKERYVLGCGCCRGPVEDRCCCHMHQDIQHGLRAHKCSDHACTEAA